MTRRRSAPSVRVYRGPLWKYAHPVQYLGSEARKATRAMRSARVLGRVFSVPEIRKALRTQTVQVTAASRRADLARAERRAAAAAKAAQPSRKAAAVRKRDGSVAMTDRDREAWQRAVGGVVDPALRARSPRRRG